MSRYAVIEGGRVVAAIEWDGSASVAGQLVRTDTAAIGDAFVGGLFTPPAPVERPKSELDTLVDTLVAKGLLTENDRPRPQRNT